MSVHVRNEIIQNASVCTVIVLIIKKPYLYNHLHKYIQMAHYRNRLHNPMRSNTQSRYLLSSQAYTNILQVDCTFPATNRNNRDTLVIVNFTHAIFNTVMFQKILKIKAIFLIITFQCYLW